MKFKKIRITKENYLKIKKVISNYKNEQLRTKFYIGQKVKVFGELETVIEKIENNKYYFYDENGMLWNEVEEAIEAI
jgi:hypothetical protein